MKMTQNYQIILPHYIYFFLGIFISSSVYLFLPHFIYFFLTIFISSSLYLLTYLSSAEMKLQRKLLTPFKLTEARVVGGRKVVERRGLSIKIEIMIKEIVLSSSFKFNRPLHPYTLHMLRICSGLFNGTRPKRRIHIELSLFEKNCKIALQSLFLGLALQ